jgi:hypothetical protein
MAKELKESCNNKLERNPKPYQIANGAFEILSKMGVNIKTYIDG